MVWIYYMKASEQKRLMGSARCSTFVHLVVWVHFKVASGIHGSLVSPRSKLITTLLIETQCAFTTLNTGQNDLATHALRVVVASLGNGRYALRVSAVQSPVSHTVKEAFDAAPNNTARSDVRDPPSRSDHGWTDPAVSDHITQGRRRVEFLARQK